MADLQLPTGARGRLDAGLRLTNAITVEVGRADADLWERTSDAHARRGHTTKQAPACCALGRADTPGKGFDR